MAKIMYKEFVIWGIAPNGTEETILYTKAQSEEEARNVMTVLVSRHNCQNCRLQIVDLSPGYNSGNDFINTINKRESSPRGDDVTRAKTMNTFYRVDEYTKHMGSLIGFYKNLLEYDSELIQTAESSSGNYIQITEFKSSEDAPGLKAWENGRIVANFYFEAEK